MQKNELPFSLTAIRTKVVRDMNHLYVQNPGVWNIVDQGAATEVRSQSPIERSEWNRSNFSIPSTEPERLV